MKINILGHEYNLEAEEGMYFNSNNYGLHSLAKLQITYDPDMKETVYREAIFHELFEALNYWVDTDLEHHKLTILSASLFSILKNNPELLKLLFGDNNDK